MKPRLRDWWTWWRVGRGERFEVWQRGLRGETLVRTFRWRWVAHLYAYFSGEYMKHGWFDYEVREAAEPGTVELVAMPGRGRELAREVIEHIGENADVEEGTR